MINMNEVFGFRVTYSGIWAVAAQARILDGVRSLYLWSEEYLTHPFERQAEEVQNSPRTFQLEFPHPERPAFARQHLSD